MGRAWGTVQASVASDLGVRSAVWWTCSLPLLDALESGEMASGSYSPVAVPGLLTVVSFLVVEPGP